MRTPANLRDRPLEYGIWLRAAGERASRRVQITVEGSNRRSTGSRWKSDTPPKPTPPPYQPPAASPPCTDFAASDMEVAENLVQDQIRADFPHPNPKSFEESLHDIDVEFNYVSENKGEYLPAGNSHIEPTIHAETLENSLGQLNLNYPLNPSRAPLSDISNQWASSVITGKPKTGSWKKKARSKDPITTTSPLILAEKRTNAEAFQAGPTEVRQTKTARLFQNELLSVEARTQPHRHQ